MRLITFILAAVFAMALLALPAAAQDSPGAPPGDDGVGGVVVTPRVGVPAAGHLADTGFEISTGAALAGALVLGGGAVLFVTRRRPTSG